MCQCVQGSKMVEAQAKKIVHIDLDCENCLELSGT